MTDSATPATAPGDGATIDERRDYVMGLLNKQPEKESADKISAETAEPDGEKQEVEPADTAKATGDETDGDGQTESEASTDTEAETETSQEKPALVKVKVDGQEFEVTLEEAIKGYSRTEDYKRKTASLAEERRALERERADLQAKASQTSGDYLTIAQQANEDSLLLAAAEKTDWVKLAQADPAKYTAARAQVEAASARMAQAAQERDQNRRAYLAEQHKFACEHIPEYADEKSRAKFVESAGSLMAEYGFTSDEIANLGDSRALRVVSDALKYRELKAKTEAATKQIQQKKVGAAQVISQATRMPANAGSESKRAFKARIEKTTDMRERAALAAEYAARFPT